MSSYTVDFWKSVENEDGQSHEVCAARLQVEAGDADEARKRAEGLFCGERGLTDWSEGADRVSVEAPDAPPRPAAAPGDDADQPWSHVDT